MRVECDKDLAAEQRGVAEYYLHSVLASQECTLLLPKRCKASSWSHVQPLKRN